MEGHPVGLSLKGSPCPVSHEATHLCVPAGRTQGRGERRVCPFSQKTDLLRTRNLLADSCLGLCWVSLCPLAVWGASPCPYPNSYPEMAAGAWLSSLAPRRGSMLCPGSPSCVPLRRSWPRASGWASPLDALAASLFQLKYKILETFLGPWYLTFEAEIQPS